MTQPPAPALATGPGLAAFAALLADDTRAAFCLALLDGRAWTAGELARHAGVAPSTASAHLTRLVEGGLLTEVRQGRHRYVCLAGPAVAQVVEDMAAHAVPAAPARTLRAASAEAAMARARTCYDHLAGRLGVLVTEAMTRLGLLEQTSGFALTREGTEWYAALGIDLAAPRGGNRPVARPCLDFTERRPHLAGTAGAALCRHALAAEWCVRIGSRRALKVTDAGRQAFSELFALTPEDLDAVAPRPAVGAAAAG
ncbi:helix-turn-helix transcriptional regulator [Streptomyces sp. I05A-00742]|uniref:ArsR/SmtB family transcription factor n=1 Tax=Streptomyces sp. I05A-00742 TaxID=2732853 RepID=UPI0014896E45|nr:winged helix-turn-helix domain-containing protein [Streptomyces sp. I05A-00742]